MAQNFFSSSRIALDKNGDVGRTDFREALPNELHFGRAAKDYIVGRHGLVSKRHRRELFSIACHPRTPSVQKSPDLNCIQIAKILPTN